MNTQTKYHAFRGTETPGIEITAGSLVSAKSQASRRLEPGASSGMKIKLIAVSENGDGVVRIGQVWEKLAHHDTGWTSRD